MTEKQNTSWVGDLLTELLDKPSSRTALSAPEPMPNSPTADAPDAARKKAIRSACNMLEYASCSSAKLREKLARKGYTREDIAAAIRYVTEKGLLNEARDAAHRVEYLANAMLYGKRKIVESLLAKGYRREHLVAADWDSIDFVEICRRYLARHASPDREKTIAAARRRGFSMAEILTCLQAEK